MQTIYKGIQPGAEIEDVNGHKVGTVHEVLCNAADELQTVTVQRGLIFKTDVGIPAAAIGRVEGGKIYLTVEKSTLVELLKPDAAQDRVTPGPMLDADELESGVDSRTPNDAAIRPDIMHDRVTGARIHDQGIGSAAVPPMGAGNPTMVTGGAGTLNPTQSQEPTGDDRT